jgi:hypothetical protein
LIISQNNGELIEDNTIKGGKLSKLVVLYSTEHRDLDNNVDTHVKVFDKISDSCIISLYTWTNEDVKVPELIKKYPHVFVTADNKHILDGYHVNKIYTRKHLIGKSFVESTQKALENSEKLYKETYGVEMPMDQVIIRLRPDSKITNIDKFPFPPMNEDYFYMGTWNTAHRVYNKDQREIDFGIMYTTKRALLNIFKIPTFDIRPEEDVSDNLRVIDDGSSRFFEFDLYFILKRMLPDLKIIFTYDIHLALRNGTYFLTDQEYIPLDYSLPSPSPGALQDLYEGSPSPGSIQYLKNEIKMIE